MARELVQFSLPLVGKHSMKIKPTFLVSFGHWGGWGRDEVVMNFIFDSVKAGKQTLVLISLRLGIT